MFENSAFAILDVKSAWSDDFYYLIWSLPWGVENFWVRNGSLENLIPQVQLAFSHALVIELGNFLLVLNITNARNFASFFDKLVIEI